MIQITPLLSRHPALVACSLALLLAPASAPQAKSGTPQAKTSPPQAANNEAAALAKAFAEQGIHFDADKGICAISAEVLVREDLLEYLLVNGIGAAHESAFVTSVVPSVLNSAMLALGATPGQNAAWVPRNPPPTPEEQKAGQRAWDVKAPEGDGFYLYAAWKSGGETYLYRVEDLLLDRATGQTMRRHKWVFLGSRMVNSRAAGGTQVFAADAEGNLINVALFEQGNTLLTAALPECLEQTIWMTNFWLVPPRDARIQLVFSKERLVTLPADLEKSLPDVPVEPRPK